MSIPDGQRTVQQRRQLGDGIRATNTCSARAAAVCSYKTQEGPTPAETPTEAPTTETALARAAAHSDAGVI